MLKDLKVIVRLLEEIRNLIAGKDEMSELEKEYQEYKYFADSRGMKMLSVAGLVDEYNDFMSRCEEILFSNSETSTFAARIELPKPSSALEAFKNRFNKFF